MVRGKKEKKKKKVDDISRNLNTTDREGAFKICVFGDEFPGKTTLINRYFTKVFDEDIKMTVGVDFYVKDLEIEGKKVVLRLWDFGGEQRFKALLPSFAKGADGGIFLFDVSSYTSLKNIDDWLSIFETSIIFEENVLLVRKLLPIIMVGVLPDGKNNLRAVSAEEAVKIAKSRNLNGYIECNLKTEKYFEEVFEDLQRLPLEHGIERKEKNGIDSFKKVSSKTGQNVDKIFEIMTDLMLKRMEGDDYIRFKEETYILNKMMSKKESLYKIQLERGHYDILLIEDDLATIRLLTGYFKSIGVTCKGVVSGRKGLEELVINRPKVVLLNVILPDYSGFEICKKIKSIPELENIPVFFFTAVSGSMVEKHLAETKADGYIHKPFDYSDFDGVLDLLKSNSVKKVEIQPTPSLEHEINEFLSPREREIEKRRIERERKRNRTAKLRVERLESSRSGRSLCYIDPDILDNLGLYTSDIIEILGKKRTAGIVVASIADKGKGIIKIDWIQRKNSGSNIGEFVTIKLTRASPAREVELAPTKGIYDIKKQADIIKGKLIDKPITTGDIIDISYIQSLNFEEAIFKVLKKLVDENNNLKIKKFMGMLNMGGKLRIPALTPLKLIVKNTNPDNEVVRFTRDTRIVFSNSQI